MHVDEPKTKELVGRLVQKMTSNPTLWDDLLQEALIHLWLTEARRPGQTRSWYLQSCKYHLLHYLVSGRSVDSAKRRRGQLLPGDGLLDGFLDREDGPSPVLNWVCARDIV